MKQLNLIIILCIISVIFSSSFILAAELDLKINAQLNGFDTDFYAQTDADSSTSVDSFDFVQRTFPSGDYSFLYSNVSSNNLLIDTWPKADRTIYLVYRVSPSTSGTLDLSWSTGAFGTGNDTFDATLTDYGTDSTYNSSSIVSTLDMENSSSYSVASSGTLRYFKITVDYVLTSGGSTGGGGGTETPVECESDCSCASSTCVGSTCSDGCGGTCDGTKSSLCPAAADVKCGEIDTRSNGCGGTCNVVGTKCGSGEECQEGVCVQITCGILGSLSCNDNNPCTEDKCINGLCDYNTFNTNNCDDGNACTIGDECRSGTCQPGDQKTCPADLPVCDPDNGDCGPGKTPDEIPLDILDLAGMGGAGFGCVVDITQVTCGEWGACEANYDVAQLISGEPVSGIKKRTCSDSSKCLPNYEETASCIFKEDVIVNTTTWCGEEYTEVRNAKTGVLLSRLKQTADGKSISVDISASGEAYCPYCYDGTRNYDEEGIDCGGSCSSCEISTTEYPVQVYNTLGVILSTAAFLFFLVSFIFLTADIAIIIKSIFLIKQLGGKYDYWKRQGYNVEALESNLNKLEKAYDYKLKHRHKK